MEAEAYNIIKVAGNITIIKLWKIDTYYIL